MSCYIYNQQTYKACVSSLADTKTKGPLKVVSEKNSEHGNQIKTKVRI